MTTTLEEALTDQERAWRERPLVRALYGDWFRLVAARLSHRQGASVELGAGIGRFHEACPWVIPTDVAPTPWAQAVVDAEALPFSDGELANLVLIDVFHDLARPARLLDEAVRTLGPGGRVVIVDPYCSPVSAMLYRRFHHERTDLGADPFGEDVAVDAAPLASNQARATLVFFRNRGELELRWPELRVEERRRLAVLAYPLSGGFTGRRLVPTRLDLALRTLEPLLAPLTPLSASRVPRRRRAALALHHGAALKTATRNFQKAKSVIRRSSMPWRQRLMFVVPYVRGW